MESNPEQRYNARFQHETAVTLENHEIGVLNSARMFNFSDNGIYFESDYLIHPGTELYIGITNSPYASEPDVYECYRAEIRWRKPLKKSAFFYGYGAKFLALKLEDDDFTGAKNSRKHPRKPCSIPVKYVSQNKIQQGEIKDISLGGIFLKTDTGITVGKRLQLAIPVRKKGKVLKRAGKIVWANQSGVGIEFQRSVKK